MRNKTFLPFLLMFSFLLSCGPNESPEYGAVFKAESGVCYCECPCPDDPVEGARIEGNENVLAYRVGGQPGYVPTERHLSHFIESEHAPDVSLLDDPYYRPPLDADHVFVVTPELGRWEALPVTNERYRVFVFLPGDYTPWGEMPRWTVRGTKDRPVVFRYYSEKYGYDVPHPKTLPREEMAIIENFAFGGKALDGSEAATWTWMYGLSIIGKTFKKDGQVGGAGNWIGVRSEGIYFLHGYAYKSRGLRAYGNNHALFHLWAEGKIKAKGDIGGWGFYTIGGIDSEDNRIVSCHIEDASDMIGLPKDGRNYEDFGFVPGTIIADNHLLFTDDVRVIQNGKEYNYGEDLIDVKNGSNDPSRPVLIEGNICHGARPTLQIDGKFWGGSGSIGTGIVVQKDCDYVIVRNNLIYDCVDGIVLAAGKDPTDATNNLAYNNLVFDMHPHEQSRPGQPDDIRYAQGINMNSEGSVAAYNSVFNTLLAFPKTNGKRKQLYAGNLASEILLPGIPATDFGNVAIAGHQVGNPLPYGGLRISVDGWLEEQIITFQSPLVAVEDLSDQFIDQYGEEDYSGYLQGAWFWPFIAEDFEQLSSAASPLPTR
jgi:hypothetical protein